VEITTNTDEMQRIIREYLENLCSNKLKSLEEMDKFLDASDLLKLNQLNRRDLNRSVTSHENETVTKSLNKEGLKIRAVHCQILLDL
jgi:hypothetical protein